MLGAVSNGNLTTQLPSGLLTNSFNLHLSVLIYDKYGSFTLFNLKRPVQVLPTSINLTLQNVKFLVNNSYKPNLIIIIANLMNNFTSNGLVSILFCILI